MRLIFFCFLSQFQWLQILAQESLRIGILLESEAESVVTDAVNSAVASLPLLPGCEACSNVQTSLLTLSPYDMKKNRNKLRNLKAVNISIVIGPTSIHHGLFVEEMCRELGLIYIYTYWKMVNDEEKIGRTFGLFPSTYFSNLVDLMIQQWKWRSFGVITDNKNGVSHLMSHFSRQQHSPFVIRVKSSKMEDMLDAAKELRNSCDRAQCWNMTNKALVLLDQSSTVSFLEACMRLGMISPSNWFIVTSLDDLVAHVQPYSHNHMRLSLPVLSTAFNASNIPENVLSPYLDMYRVWRRRNWKADHTTIMFSLIVDSIILACHIHSQTNLTLHYPRETPSFNISFHGLSGPVRFESSTERSDAILDILEMGIHGESIHIGTYTIDRGDPTLTVHMKDLPGTHDFEFLHAQQRKVLKVTTIEERPYVMEKVLPDGKIVYEGFCVDLLDKLALFLGFEYSLHIVRDAKYGRPLSNSSSEWDGMIGEILRGEADLAVAPITVTARRLEVVDFTDPFLQLGISMLMRTPDKKATASITSFMWPLSPSVWMFSALATVLSALAVTFIAVLSPKESPKLFNLKNNLWYLMCILLRAGSGLNCQSSASRIASSVWWTFSLVLIAQYTANFAAVLTVDRKSTPFNSFEELGNQTEYTFGSIYGGSTMQFFQYSRLETFKRIWEKMASTKPSVFVDSNDQGVQRVLNEKYVFLMESASLEYEVTQNCNLTRVGNVVLGSNGYSIAVPKGSRWREKLTRQILDFNEKGIMMMLKNNWWKSSEQTESGESPAIY